MLLSNHECKTKMAFWLNRSGRQMVRLSSSSSWSAKPSPPPLILTSINNNNNCFSTCSSPDAALKDKLVTCVEYVAKSVVNLIQTKPLPSDPDFHKLVDDLYERLAPVDSETKDFTLETDQSEKNPKATTPGLYTPDAVKRVMGQPPKRLYTADEVIKKLLEQSQIIHTLQFQEEKPYKGDDFEFDTCTDLKVNVLGLGKEDLVVWVSEEHVLVSGTNRVGEPEKTVEEVIRLPDGLNYNPDEVTGTIMEDGRLKITFPGSKEEGSTHKAKYFKVKLV